MVPIGPGFKSHPRQINETFFCISKHCDLFVTFSSFPDDFHRSINLKREGDFVPSVHKSWKQQRRASSDHSEPLHLKSRKREAELLTTNSLASGKDRKNNDL